MFRLSALLLLSAAIAVESAPCPFTDNSIYSPPGSGQGYQIKCGTDYFTPNNLAYFFVQDFQECVAKCQANAQCVGVSARNVHDCYLKSYLPGPTSDDGVISAIKLGATPAPATAAPATAAPATAAPATAAPATAAPATAAPATAAPATAAPTSAPPANCPAADGSTYTIPGTNARYIIECQKDHFTTQNLAYVPGVDFFGCIGACQANSQCAAISYRNGCYLKSNPVPAATPNPDVTSALRVVASCPYPDGSTQIFGGKRYRIECNTDRFTTQNLAQLDAATIDQCAAACSATSGCAGVSQYGSGCYLKSAPVPGASSKDKVTSAVQY